MLLENGGWALFITTPRGRNHAYETHMMAQTNDEWLAQILTIDDTGRITPEQIEKERAEGMPEAKIQQEYYCSFEADSETQFIPSQYITAGRRIEHPNVQLDDPVILGVDVARFGDDKSVIYPRRGRDARTLPIDIFQGMDTMQLAAHVADRITTYNAAACFIDEGGVGSGVVDRLRQLNFRVQGVNFGAGSDRRIEGAPPCANKRAEMWATMREHMRDGLALPTNDALSFELLAPTYHFDANNRILLEKKEDMKKRGVRSPDIADALALTYAYPVLGQSVAEQLEAQAAQDYDPIWSR
jgi:phage terminase large subunit